MNPPPHCFDGPTDLNGKRRIYIANIDELETSVDEVVRTGDTNVELTFSPALLLDPKAYDILGRIVTDHPRSQPNAQSSRIPSQPEAEAETQAEAEVISYVEGSLEEQTHRGFSYQVFESAEGYRVKVHQGCAGWAEPFDCAFKTIGEADETGTGYIDHIILQAEKSAKEQ